jgi:hypothetical protein
MCWLWGWNGEEKQKLVAEMAKRAKSANDAKEDLRDNKAISREWYRR